MIIGLILFGLGFARCDSGLAHEKHITGKYYIIGLSDNDLALSYEIGNGNYIGKAPNQLTEYGFNDTFIVAKSKEDNVLYHTYYIIDMTKDSELALEETFRIGPLAEKDFDSLWKQRLNIVMKKIH